jgi:hypothetical protein
MRRLGAAAIVVWLAVAPPLAARSAPSLEYDVKAAFLLNFTRFIDWPGPSPVHDAPFRVCVFRSDPFGDTLPATLEGEYSNGRRLTPMMVTSPSHATDCDVVFVPRAQSAQVEEVLRAVKGLAVLTVGESPNFLQHGGIVNFVVERDRVRFDINAAAADASGLRVSSKLLRLARHVVPAERGRR